MGFITAAHIEQNHENVSWKPERHAYEMLNMERATSSVNCTISQQDHYYF